MYPIYFFYVYLSKSEGLTAYMRLFRHSIILILFTQIVSAVNSQEWALPEKGILDLRNYDFNEHWYLKLDGEWEFYWESFIDPDAFAKDQFAEPTLFVVVPGYWNDYKHDTIDFRGEGYATYRLRIILPEDFTSEIGFDIPVFDASFNLYLDNDLVWSNGKPGDSWAHSEAGYDPGSIQYRPLSDTLQVLLHVSNFHHRRGAFWRSMQIGHPDKMAKTEYRHRFISFLSLGFLLAFSLFFFFFFIFYREDKIILFFSLVLAGIFIRLLHTDLYPINYLIDIPWNCLIRMEYVGSFLAFGAGLWYLYLLFPVRYMLPVSRINTLLVILSVMVITFFDVKIFAFTMLYFQPAVLLLLLYYLVVSIRRVFSSKKDEVIYLVAILVLMAAFINDMWIANSQTAISKDYTMHFAIMVFVFLHAAMIIRNWIRAYKERGKLMKDIEYINRNLESMIEERTRELNMRNQEIQQKNENIEAQNKELKEALDFKNKVFSIIAHDLKSPVASLVQNSVLLDFDLEEDKRTQLFSSFRELSSAALNLIDNLLYWGRSQGEQVNFNPESIDIKPVIEEVYALYKEMAGQKSITLEAAYEERTTAFADKELIEIIIRNLVSNAIKFTNGGGNVRITVTKDPENEHLLLLMVKDNGIGIPENRLKDLLGNNEMISTVGTAREKGTGLGLRLCYELVKLHNGKFRIESVEGQGTTVYISLPT
jgi:signal transduction histidine kinase